VEVAITTNEASVDLLSTLQDRLEEARREKGVSVAEARAAIQRLTGLSRATMTHWWNGKAKEPRGGAAVRAAEYLGVNPLWLAQGRGPKRTNGKGERTMPVPKDVHLDEEEIATCLRLAAQMTDRARAIWFIQGQGLVELTRRPSRANPYGTPRAAAKGKGAVAAAVKGPAPATRSRSPLDLTTCLSCPFRLLPFVGLGLFFC